MLVFLFFIILGDPPLYLECWEPKEVRCLMWCHLDESSP